MSRRLAARPRVSDPESTVFGGPDARVNPHLVPSGTERRFAWIRRVPREMDDAKVLAALRSIRDPDADAGDQAYAYATLWRALKPLIEATVVRVMRTHRGTPLTAVYEAVDAEITYLLLKVESDTLGGFFSYASRSLQHASYVLDREEERGRTTVSVEELGAPHEAGLSFYERQAAKDDGPADDLVEQTLLAAIHTAVSSDHHRTILAHHFGVGPFRGRGEQNRRVIGEHYGITGERVRQLSECVRRQLRAQLGLDEADGDEDDAG